MIAVEQDIQAILAARAQALAQPLVDAALAAGDLQLVVLQVGDERYALRSEWVEEVQSLSRITPVPGLAHHWRGLVNLRGRLFPVLDLQQYLVDIGLLNGCAAPAGDQRLVLVTASGCTVALLVDDVPAVRSLAQTDIEPSLVEPQGALNAMLPGITTDLMTMLDLPAMFADQRLLVGSRQI
jgi:purine-binding chemotaxis protein CheW